MKRLYNIIKTFLCDEIGADKYLHTLICLCLSYCLCRFYSSFASHNFIAVFFAVASAMLIGTLKELWDNRNDGEFSLLDLLADAVGCVLGLLLYFI